MKATVSTAALLGALRTVGRVVPKKSTLPIIQGVLIEANGDGLRLTGTDLETTITDHLDAQVDGPWCIVAPYAGLLALAQRVPGDEVVLDLGRDHELTVRWKGGRLKVVGFDPSDFPAIPALGDGTSFEVDADVLRTAWPMLTSVVSHDGLRPAMMGVCFDGANSALVATDGHRLVSVGMEVPFTAVVRPEAVPVKALSGTVTVTSDGRHVGVQSGSVRSVSLLIDETYPNWQAVMPDEHQHEWRPVASDVQASLGRALLAASQMTHQVRLDLKERRIQAEDIESARSYDDALPGDVTGEGLVIGFNGHYLSEMFGLVGDAEPVVYLSSPNRAARFEWQTHGLTVNALTMPVLLNTWA